MNHKKFRTPVVMVTSAALVFGAASAAQALPQESDYQNPSSVGNLLSSGMTDAELDSLISKLEALPEDLKNADPRTTPNYEQRLSEALNGTTQSGDTLVSYALAPTIVAYGGSWWACAGEIGKVILQYGIPVAKVLKWLKEAKALYGGVRGIIRAIRYGGAIAEIGAEGAAVLEMVLGIDGVVGACF